MTNNSSNGSVLALVFITSLLAACGSEQKPTAPPPVEDTVFRDMSGAMDKARAVDGTVQEQKESLDRALEPNQNSTAQ
jgi:hypothetical protein